MTTWGKLTNDKRDALVHSTALGFLDSPRLQEYTAGRLRETASLFWALVADAMDAETAVREAREAFHVVTGGA